MSRVENLAAQIAELPNHEKRQLLHLVLVKTDFMSRGITSDPRICGGDACVVRTRIPVWLLIQARRMGATDLQILASYPSLNLEDLENAWAYAEAHPHEIEQQILHHEAA